MVHSSVSWYNIFDNCACALEEAFISSHVEHHKVRAGSQWCKMDSIYACALSVISCHPTKFHLYPLIYLFTYLFIHYFQFPACNYWYMNMPLVAKKKKQQKNHLDLERTIRNRLSRESPKRSKHLKQTDEERWKHKSDHVLSSI